MTTRISVTEPSRLLEASKALQAANQRRLQDRTEDGWMQRDATRLVKRGLGLADSLISKAAGQRDPWRGAVPEFEKPEFFPVQLRGKRFQVAGAYWRWDKNARTLTVTTADRSASASAEVPAFNANTFDIDEAGVVWYQAFPAGEDRMVLLFYMEGITYQVNTTETVTGPAYTPNDAPVESETCWNGGFNGFDQAVVDGEVCRSFTEATVSEVEAYIDWYNEGVGPGDNPIRLLQGPFQPGNPWTGIFDHGPQGAIYSRKFTRTTHRTYSNLQLSKELACFVVRKSSAHKIACPGELLRLVKQKYRYAESIAPDPEVTVETYGDYYIIVEFYNPAGEQESLGVHYIFTGELYSLEESGQGYIVQRPNTNNYETDAATQLTLLRSYGYGKLLNRPNGQDSAWGWTPVAFSFLRNYDGEFHGAGVTPNGYDYDYIAGKYFPADAPFVMLEAEYNTSQGQPAQYYYFVTPGPGPGKNLKAPTAFYVPPVLPRRAGGPIQQRTVPVASQYDDSTRDIWRTGAEVPVATWDWNRPLACLIELQRLGFTAGDLMLTPEETAALAAADPAVVGFKF